MKINLQLAALFLILPFLSCSNEDKFTGSGNIISQSRDVASFAKVDNSTSINVFISKGGSIGVEVSADDNIISDVKTVVENGILKVDLSKGNYVDVTLSVVITILNLEGLENTGSGNMTVSGFEDLGNLVIDNEGSGNISLSGSGTALSLKNSGSGSFKGFSYVVNNCTVTNSGSGNCEINCTATLNGANSGSGSIFYLGNPSVDVSNTGSGKVEDSN